LFFLFFCFFVFLFVCFFCFLLCGSYMMYVQGLRVGCASERGSHLVASDCAIDAVVGCVSHCAQLVAADAKCVCCGCHVNVDRVHMNVDHRVDVSLTSGCCELAHVDSHGEQARHVWVRWRDQSQLGRCDSQTVAVCRAGRAGRAGIRQYHLTVAAGVSRDSNSTFVGSHAAGHNTLARVRLDHCGWTVVVLVVRVYARTELIKN
jgi:hypothetical protein